MLRTAPSPFGTHTAHAASCAAPRPVVAAAAATASSSSSSSSSMRRANSSGLTRQFSSTLQQQKTLAMPTRQRSRCCAISETLELVSSASAAVSSFDDVCEALGDIAKLNSMVARGGGSAAAAAAAVLAPLPGAPAVGFDLSVALSWGVEKVVGGLGSLALLEGLVDKTLIDTFQQTFSALELAGCDTPWLRLGVAVAIAVAVRQAVVGYQAAHPQRLQRQLSPAASLSDTLAEQAAAAVLNAAGLGGGSAAQKQQQMERQPTQAFAAAAALGAPAASAVVPVDGSSSVKSDSGSSSSSSVLANIISAAVKDPRKVVPKAFAPAALAGSTLLLLGQAKRFNKLKRQAAAQVAEVARGSWSPAALLVLIEAAALVHSYSELAQGLATLLHIGA